MKTPTSALARRVIELACHAPSVHNTQPWRWRVIDDTVVELYPDRSRQLLVSDPTGRNLVLSCGAALHHAVVAARALGLTADTELMPSSAEDGPLGRIHLTAGVETEESTDALISLERRCTDRRRFTSWPIPDARLAHLSKAASAWGAHAVALTEATTRFRTEELVKRAMEVQAANPRLVDEQDEWVDHTTVDGIQASLAAPVTQGRPPTHATRFAAETAEPGFGDVIESSDGLMVLCSAVDDQLSWLKAGQGLSAMWLQATHEGFSVVPLSQVIEVDETRHALHHDVFDGMARPQILLRVGWQETSRSRLPRTSRRPLSEVIDS